MISQKMISQLFIFKFVFFSSPLGTLGSSWRMGTSRRMGTSLGKTLKINFWMDF